MRATLNDKELVADILTRSFVDNKSVNYIIKQDEKKEQRLKRLMEYSFDICNLFGDVFISKYNYFEEKKLSGPNIFKTFETCSNKKRANIIAFFNSLRTVI